PHSVTRIDRRLSFDWTDSLIESRIADVKSVTWSGNLLVRTGGRHTFHAQVSGGVTVSVDDHVVFSAEGANVFASGAEVDLAAGDHRIQVEFQTTLKNPDGKVPADFRMQLFWSSPEFTLEPLPADVLTHVAEIDAENAQRGRRLVDALRCAACHTGLDELPTLKAPGLLRLRGNTAGADIVRRLAHPETVGAWSSMPAFGFSESEAKDVAAFLIDASEADADNANDVAKFKPEDVDAGQKLLLTTGCAACHAMSQLPNGYEPQAAPYHGPDLSNLAERRNAAWLATWLKTPQTINADHRMPVFALSEDEQRQIVAALVQTTASVQKNSDEEITSDAAAIMRGRDLVKNANCASCHRIAGIEAPKASRLRPLADATRVQGHNCLAEKSLAADASALRLPRFQLNEVQRDQIRAWLATLNANLPASAQFARGEFLLHRNGCVACHDRDQQTGLSTMAATIEARRDDLRGQSQALIPPPLTAVGDRLQDDYLLRAVAGEHDKRRLPWLLVRMPRFELSQEDRKGIVRYFVGSDRIPESADVARRELFTHLDPQHPTIATAQELLVGNQLVGAGGFNCIACHTAGAYEPKNVAMGTRGSDVMTMGQRVRSRYFMRWMRNPIRVVPGIEMPAIRKPVGGVLEESLSQQIAVLWKALADPNFSPPTVVSRYEQFVTLSPGDRPRVIRDVFTIGNAKERDGVARAFAVGFENGHNLLLDLDSLQLRQWTIGEFARQRTEGKSWFWDMAGVTLFQTKGDRAFLSLVNPDEPDSTP
ncbi:MAG: c-type cytochrome, partial [Fuerstia sp.]|nr:c-type cytochrome [Fuerstiella sp.]